MKKFLRQFSWIFTLPFFLVVGTFAVTNMDFVTLDFWPFPWLAPVPLSILILGSVFAGFLLGGLAIWTSAGRQRGHARAARNRIAQLERDLQILRHEKARAEAKATATAGNPSEAVLLRRPDGPGQSAA